MHRVANNSRRGQHIFQIKMSCPSIHDTVLTRQSALPTELPAGSSADRALSLQHNTRQRQTPCMVAQKPISYIMDRILSRQQLRNVLVVGVTPLQLAVEPDTWVKTSVNWSKLRGNVTSYAAAFQPRNFRLSLLPQNCESFQPSSACVQLHTHVVLFACLKKTWRASYPTL